MVLRKVIIGSVVIFTVMHVYLSLNLYTFVNCDEIMKKYKIQVPKTTEDHYDWGTASLRIQSLWKVNGCENALKNQKTVLGPDDVLPNEVLVSKLTEEQSKALYELTVTTLEHLNNKEIQYFPVFGTALAAYRNGVAITPWDDDIDLCIDNRNGNVLKTITNGLEEIEMTNGYFDACPGNDPCRMWKINHDTVITYKQKGVPFKITKIGSYFPVIDLTTFYSSDDYNIIKTPVHELATGHIHSFEKNMKWIFPLVKHRIKFSYEIRAGIDMLMPVNAPEFIFDDYGYSALTTCITSFNHQLFCQKKDCEHVSANHLPKLIFPCALLPSELNTISSTKTHNQI